MRNKCDKCGSDILMGRCSCGYWFEKGNHPQDLKNIENALMDFHKSGKDISSGDHHTGCCFVFFRGDYEKCMIVVKLVEQLEALIHTIEAAKGIKE